MIKDVFNHLPEMNRQVRKMSHTAVQVGVLPNEDSFIKMIAVVHEYGVHITPKKGRWLYVPGPNGEVYKLDHVDIPRRSFLRSTYADKRRKWEKFQDDGVQKIRRREMTANELQRELGEMAQNDIRTRIRLKRSPKNAPLTVANKGKNDPLVDTGKLEKSIKYRIVKI